MSCMISVQLLYSSHVLRWSDNVYQCVYFFHDTPGSWLMQLLIDYQYKSLWDLLKEIPNALAYFLTILNDIQLSWQQHTQFHSLITLLSIASWMTMWKMYLLWKRQIPLCFSFHPDLYPNHYPSSQQDWSLHLRYKTYLHLLFLWCSEEFSWLHSSETGLVSPCICW